MTEYFPEGQRFLLLRCLGAGRRSEGLSFSGWSAHRAVWVFAGDADAKAGRENA